MQCFMTIEPKYEVGFGFCGVCSANTFGCRAKLAVSLKETVIVSIERAPHLVYGSIDRILATARKV